MLHGSAWVLEEGILLRLSSAEPLSQQRELRRGGGAIPPPEPTEGGAAKLRTRARRAAGAGELLLLLATTGTMEEFHPHNDEMTFNTEDTHNIIKDCIEGVLGKADYSHEDVNQWTAAIVEQSLTHLVKLGKTYKYIVTCAVMQKCGAGLHTASSCFWDTTTDGTCTVRWENRTMNCVVNVFAVAIIL